MSSSKQFSVLGVMSGTSLDGLDIAHCIIQNNSAGWNFEIKEAITIPYAALLLDKLKHSKQLLGLDLALLDVELGQFIGNECLKFINKKQLNIDFIASHGHTVFHLPEQGLTTQIGAGNWIHSITNLTVINDFRTADVAHGGQGAPLVPIGDQLLFSEYDVCVNLGGFSNLTYTQNDKVIAFDVCPVNIVLNKLCEKLQIPYDDEGNIARSGKVNQALLQQLNELFFYQQKPPKSLGLEWVEEHIFPLLEQSNCCTTELIATFTHHVGIQLSDVLNNIEAKKVLFTGGGAYNKFLLELIKTQFEGEIIIPSSTIIEYKEALIFALLGVLRMENQPNCLASVTGASKDVCGGVFFC